MYKVYESDDFNKIYEVSSTLKDEKLKINKILIEKLKEILENLDFEQNQYPRTATGIYKTGHDSFRLVKWICYYDRSFF